MIAGVVERGWGRLLLERTVLVGIGVESYGVYLWHFPVMRWIQLDLVWTGAGALALGALLTGALTEASWGTGEGPARRWWEPAERYGWTSSGSWGHERVRKEGVGHR